MNALIILCTYVCIQREAKAHFGCDTLTGILLEDLARPGTGGTHFKRRILHVSIYSETSLIRHLYNPTFSLIQPLHEVQLLYIRMVRGTP